jgi:hypothetical protein
LSTAVPALNRDCHRIQYIPHTIYQYHLLYVGLKHVIKTDLEGDPAKFHEALCRASFEKDPVRDGGTGCAAQRALLHGGTLTNGKVAIQFRESHGKPLRELVAKKRFNEGDDVTCYGGFVGLAPMEKQDHTHMRSIPLSDYVLCGQAMSDCFPGEPCALYSIGHIIALSPHCQNPDWAVQIASSGIGYMANTVTKCPIQRRARPNVTVCSAMLGRHIPGVPYHVVMVLRASAGGIDIDEPIISPYEAYKLKDKFVFECGDKSHYHVAGKIQDMCDIVE